MTAAAGWIARAGRALQGDVVVPGDKSISHRAIMLGAIADGVTRIVQKLRKQLPKTKILLLAVFPRGESPTDARRQVNEKTNAIIEKLSKDDMVTYLDIGPKFLAEDGTLSRKIMPDLLHLSPAGYVIWAESIEPELAKLLGDTPKVKAAAGTP